MKKELSIAELDAQSAFQLPAREMLALVTVVITNVLNNTPRQGPTRAPDRGLLVVECIGHAPDVCVWMLGVCVDRDFLEIECGARHTRSSTVGVAPTPNTRMASAKAGLEWSTSDSGKRGVLVSEL